MSPVTWGEGSGLAPSMDQLTLPLYLCHPPSPGHFFNCIGSLPPPHITVSFANIVPGDPCLTLSICLSISRTARRNSAKEINLEHSKQSFPSPYHIPEPGPHCLCSQNRRKCNAAPSDLLRSSLSTTSVQIQHL